MAYSADAISRLKDLYDWATTLVSAVSSYIPGKDYSGIPTTEMTLGDDALGAVELAEGVGALEGACERAGGIEHPQVGGVGDDGVDGTPVRAERDPVRGGRERCGKTGGGEQRE